MQNHTPSASVEVPLSIRKAERWRLAGEELRRLSPEIYDAIFALLVIQHIGLTDGDDEKITDSYFLT